MDEHDILVPQILEVSKACTDPDDNMMPRNSLNGLVEGRLMPFFLLLIVPIPVASLEMPRTFCVDPGCNDRVIQTPRYEPPPEPSGPTPEELKRQRDKVDAEESDRNGMNALARGEWERAIEFFTNAIRFDPDNVQFREHLSNAKKAAADGESAAKGQNARQTIKDEFAALKLQRSQVELKNSLEQLSSLAKSSTEGSKTTNLERARVLADCGVSTNPCRVPDRIDFPKSMVQTPAAVEFASHIPDAAKNDPGIQNSLLWFDKLEMRKADARLKIANIQKQINDGTANRAILEARKTTLTNELNQHTDDQAKVKQQVGKILVNRGMQWVESPPNIGTMPARAPSSNANR